MITQNHINSQENTASVDCSIINPGSSLGKSSDGFRLSWRKASRRLLIPVLAALATLIVGQNSVWAEVGISDNEITLGSVLATKGRSKFLGLGMKHGLMASLDNQIVDGKTVRIRFEDDLYETWMAEKKVKKLLDEGVFLMVGNVGTQNATVALPLLEAAGVPAVGFLTGAGVLRSGTGPVLNFRPSVEKEVASVVDSALGGGFRPQDICAYVQNDDVGRSGVKVLQRALIRANGTPQIVLSELASLLYGSSKTQLVKVEGTGTPINHNGPVGVFLRNTRGVTSGYKTLKQWEKRTGYPCKLVVTVGAYGNISRFIKQARSRGESWVISAVSVTGPDSLQSKLQSEKLDYDILMSQVVPMLTSNRQIVQEAKAALGKDFGFISLEGYIVGKMLLKLLQDAPKPLTRDGFLTYARNAKFDLGGVAIDFTRDNHQASTALILSKLTPAGYKVVFWSP